MVYHPYCQPAKCLLGDLFKIICSTWEALIDGLYNNYKLFFLEHVNEEDNVALKRLRLQINKFVTDKYTPHISM